RKDAAAALVAARDRLPGMLGTVAELVAVETGYEAAVEAALGAAADAVAVRSLADAAGAIALLKDQDGGRAGLLVAGTDADVSAVVGTPPGARAALDVISAPTEIRSALARLLAATVVVDDAAVAQE